MQLKIQKVLTTFLRFSIHRTITQDTSSKFREFKIIAQEKATDLMKLCNTQPTPINLEIFQNYIVTNTVLVTNVEDCERIVGEILSNCDGTNFLDKDQDKDYYQDQGEHLHLHKYHNEELGRDYCHKSPNLEPAISVDCEGVNLGRGGSVTLFQLFDHRQGHVYIFDLLTQPKMASVLMQLLTCDKIVKVLHDCKGDAANLYQEFGIKLKHIFDTQAAHYAIKVNENRSNIGMEKRNQISLTSLCHLYEIPCNPIKDAVSRKMYYRNQNFWSTRPLTEKMIAYAASDVLVLPPLYFALKAKLEKTDMNTLKIFKDECNHRILHAIRSRKSDK